MAQQSAGQNRTDAGQPSTLDQVKVLLRLGPKQVADELQLALGQMKSKGVTAGIAAGLFVGGLLLLTLLVIALVVAAVGAFALLFDIWLAALIVAGIFLVIALILALIGFIVLKRALPLMPQDAVRGLRMDLGVLREGSAFDPASLDRADEEKRRRKEEAEAEAERQKKENRPGEGEPEPVPYRELLRRTALRRDHLGSVVDDIYAQSDEEIDSHRDAQKDEAGGGQGARREDSAMDDVGEFVSARWRPLAVLGASTAAGAVFLRELVRK
ncbi:MAG: phage holin family protein [Nesterenkonia sp.]|uniref:phage holin family protein n=1 Tax=Nesterenkonia marinintestina TaxID=2979865 RepID=UPI0021BE0C99|nr:phage holin family protein [Nesterenkonia sp. GX14115]MDO5493891.1 phage holin family protein [Nesterenkonia sp.]